MHARTLARWNFIAGPAARPSIRPVSWKLIHAQVLSTRWSIWNSVGSATGNSQQLQAWHGTCGHTQRHSEHVKVKGLQRRCSRRECANWVTFVMSVSQCALQPDHCGSTKGWSMKSGASSSVGTVGKSCATCKLWPLMREHIQVKNKFKKCVACKLLLFRLKWTTVKKPED